MTKTPQTQSVTYSPSPLVGEGWGEGRAMSMAHMTCLATSFGSQTLAAPHPPCGHPLPQGERGQ
jgi:hypothetical protein